MHLQVCMCICMSHHVFALNTRCIYSDNCFSKYTCMYARHTPPSSQSRRILMHICQTIVKLPTSRAVHPFDRPWISFWTPLYVGQSNTLGTASVVSQVHYSIWAPFILLSAEVTRPLPGLASCSLPGRHATLALVFCNRVEPVARCYKSS